MMMKQTDDSMKPIQQSRMPLAQATANALANLHNGQGPALLTFWGSKGMGKTTLLKSIGHDLQESHSATIVEMWDIDKLPLEKIVKILDEKFSDIPGDKTIVLILDNLDELLRRDNDSQAFFDFEQETIQPCIEKGNILMIVSSQIELNQWREDDVRMCQINYRIPALTIEETAALMSGTGIEAQKVHELTFGQPEVVNWLLYNPSLSEKEIADKASVYFLEGIPDEARRIAQVICLLPIFNVYLFREILNKNKNAAEEAQYVECLTWIKEYIRRGLVYWDVTIGSYRFTDSAVRRLLARQVLYTDAAKFDEIQRMACDYFQAEARSPGYLHMHLVSAIYHLAQTMRNRPAQDVGKACLEWVRASTNTWLSARWSEILAAWQNGAGDQAVREEISHLIGVEYFDAIAQEINKARQMMEVTQ